MHITEFLVTGFDGDKPVFAINVGPETATVVLTGTDGSSETVVDSTWEQTSQAFAAMRRLIEDLAAVPAT